MIRSNLKYSQTHFVVLVCWNPIFKQNKKNFVSITGAVSKLQWWNHCEKGPVFSTVFCRFQIVSFNVKYTETKKSSLACKLFNSVNMHSKICYTGFTLYSTMIFNNFWSLNFIVKWGLIVNSFLFEYRTLFSRIHSLFQRRFQWALCNSPELTLRLQTLIFHVRRNIKVLIHFCYFQWFGCSSNIVSHWELETLIYLSPCFFPRLWTTVKYVFLN